MSDEQNPYASPNAASKSTPNPIEKNNLKALHWLRVAGAGILILAAMEMTGSVAALLAQAVTFGLLALGLSQWERPLWQELLILFIIFAILFRSVVMAIGALHMRSGRSCHWAKWGAIVTIVGGIYPLFWIDLGFGIWAFILLRRDKYKQLFNK
jgi:hypothetical protein